MTYQYPDPEEHTLTPARLADIWRRRKWTAVVVFLAASAAVLAAVVALPDLYRGTARVIVEREVSQDFVRPSVSAELETRIQSIHQRITRRDHLAGLIEEMNLYPDRQPTTPVQDLVGRMNRDISLELTGVERMTGGRATIAFAIGFTGRDPDRVAAVANRLADTYVQENTENRRRQAAATAEFLRGELEAVKKELDTHESQNRSFALQYTDELPQQLDVNLAALERLQAQLSLNGEQQLRLIERRERLEQELTLGRFLMPAADTASPSVRLQSLRQQLEVLRRTYSDEYPDVKRVMAEIALVEAEVARTEEETGRPVDPVAQRRESIAAIEKDLAALQREGDTLRRNISRYETIVSRTPRRQLEMDQLASGRNLTRQRYEDLLRQYEEAQLAATVEAGDGSEQFRILEAAIPPPWPIGPDRPLLAGMGLLGALALALVAVILREKSDPTVHSPDDLRGLVPDDAIVAVRRIRTKRARNRAIPRAALATIGVILVVTLCAGAAWLTAAGNEQIVRMTLRGNS